MHSRTNRIFDTSKSSKEQRQTTNCTLALNRNTKIPNLLKNSNLIGFKKPISPLASNTTKYLLSRKKESLYASTNQMLPMF